MLHLRGSRVLPALPLLLLAAAGFAWLAGCRPRAAHCDVCERDECTALAFRVEYADGGRQTTCCPKCASHAVAREADREVARLVARDFATGREIDARQALYVEGSDVEHCRAPREEPGHQTCCRVLAYDRCLPSLIAFAASDAAHRFTQEHGGAIRRFDELKFGRP